MNNKGNVEIIAMVLIGLLCIVAAALLMWVLPQYGVWRMEMSGKAELAEARWNRQIAIEEAEANLEAVTISA